jgi:hypothetical protein
MEDILIWLLNNSRNSELMKKAVNHTETMIKLVKHHALKKKYGESQITVIILFIYKFIDYFYLNCLIDNPYKFSSK